MLLHLLNTRLNNLTSDILDVDYSILLTLYLLRPESLVRSIQLCIGFNTGFKWIGLIITEPRIVKSMQTRPASLIWFDGRYRYDSV
jgi:hypothetical protein